MEVVFGDVSACERVVYKYVVEQLPEPRSLIFAARSAEQQLAAHPLWGTRRLHVQAGAEGCETAASL